MAKRQRRTQNPVYNFTQEEMELRKKPKGELTPGLAQIAERAVIQKYHQERARSIMGDNISQKYWKILFEAARQQEKHATDSREIQEALAEVMKPFEYDQEIWVQKGKVEWTVERSNIFLYIDPIILREEEP